MKKYLIAGIITIVLVAGLVTVFKKDSELEFQDPQQYFVAIIETAIYQKYDDVSVGYEPNILINVLPSLINEDFHGVETDFGKYELINGGLAFRPNEGESFNEGKLYISAKGMETLLENLATRLNIEVIDQESVENILRTVYQDKQ